MSSLLTTDYITLSMTGNLAQQPPSIWQDRIRREHFDARGQNDHLSVTGSRQRIFPDLRHNSFTHMPPHKPQSGQKAPHPPSPLSNKRHSTSKHVNVRCYFDNIDHVNGHLIGLESTKHIFLQKCQKIPKYVVICIKASIQVPYSETSQHGYIRYIHDHNYQLLGYVSRSIDNAWLIFGITDTTNISLGENCNVTRCK